MICPITDKPCRTNGCGDKCYKRDSLGYSIETQPAAKLPVMCSSFQEILLMLDRGKSVFESGYLSTLGEMQREGLIQVDLYKDGSAVVRKNCT